MPKSILAIKPAKNERIFAIGDIHGCYDELLALESKITASVARSKFTRYQIVSVGDLCDRGPDTCKVMDHFAAGRAAGTHQLILGNHEVFFMLAFMGMRPDLILQAGISYSWFHKLFMVLFPQLMGNLDHWSVNGGKMVFKSYGAELCDVDTWDLVPTAHLRLLFEAPLVIQTPKCVISHALLHRGDLEVLAVGDVAAEGSDELSDRDRESGSGSGSQDRSLAVSRCLWERTPSQIRVHDVCRHVSGHTPKASVIRNRRLGTIQIDTGAVYGKRLTALDLASFRTLKVPSDYNCRKS
ncbi:MAG: metallophosphoesterase [Proteobacteria bacterium]|nr:metallophosphoesterase [Pseudomonadota bacterium]